MRILELTGEPIGTGGQEMFIINLLRHIDLTDLQIDWLTPIISRPCNWVSFVSTQDIYFILGGKTTSPVAFQSPTNQTKDVFDLANLTNSYSTLADSNYKNGADELKSNEVTYVDDNLSSDYGKPEQGHMSVYRSAWLNDTGYFLRNEGVS